MNPLTQHLNQEQFLTALQAILELGTQEARQWLLEYFDNPSHLENFSVIFTDYVVHAIPKFHTDIYNLYTGSSGNKAVAAPRGFAKSTITDLVTLSWYCLTGRKHFIVLISDTYTQAEMFLEAFKTEMETNYVLQWLYPDAIGDLWTNSDLIVRGYDIQNDTKTLCRIIAKGAGMKVRGLKFLNFRPDLAIVDDLENDEMVESEERRRKLRQWFRKGLLPALSKEGEVVVIGTILHFDSLLKNILDKKEEFSAWRTLKFQALTEGNSLWPEHYTTEELQRMRDDPTYEKFVGPLTFSQEYQNEPLDDNQRIIRPHWLQQRFKLAEMENRYKVENPDAKDTWVEHTFRRIVGAVDPAISEKTTADYFAMITIGIARKDGHIYILDYYRNRIGDPVEQVNVIIDSYQFWKQDSIVIETVAYQKGLYALVKRIGAERSIYPTVGAVKPDKDKVRRAVIHSANFAGNLVHLREDHPLFNAFYDEVIQFPLGINDDMLDAYMNAAEETVIKPKARVFGAKPRLFTQ